MQIAYATSKFERKKVSGYITVWFVVFKFTLVVVWMLKFTIGSTGR